MTTCDRIVAFRERHGYVYALAVFLGCALPYFALLHGFRLEPAFNVRTLLCPAGGIGPVLGLYFGVPGIAGCVVASLASDVALGTYDLNLLTANLVVYTIYLGGLRMGWYLAQRGSALPYPVLTTARKLATYLLLSLALSCLSILLSWVLGSVPVGPDMPLASAVIGLNYFTFLVYLGMPLLIALNRSPLPMADRWFAGDRPIEGASHHKLARMNLTQRTVIAAVLVATLVIVVLNVLYFVPYPFYQGYYDMMPDLISGAYALSAIATAVIFVPITLALQFLETHYTTPVERVTRSLEGFLGHLQAGGPVETTIDMTGATPRNEVLELVDGAEQVERSLVDHIDRLSEALKERERASAELSIARQLQMSVVPHDFAAYERYGLDVYGFMRPAREVGGDFYDVMDLGSGRVGFLVGDVSGKGVPAALFMMRALNVLRLQMQSCDDLGRALTLSADALFQRGNETDFFVTAFLCVLDTRTGRLTYANAGHTPPRLRQSGRGGWLACEPERIISGYFRHRYTQYELRLEPGDGMLMYTDGMTDAVDDRRRFFGEEGLEHVIRTVEGRAGNIEPPLSYDVRAAVRDITTAVDRFVGDAPQADDMTMLAFSFSGPVREGAGR